MVAIQRHAKRMVTLAVALVAVLLVSVVMGAASSQPVPLKGKLASGLTTDSSNQPADLGASGTSESSEESDYSGPTWMPETEAEHPMYHPEPVKGVSLPILLHGAAWHVYHDFFCSLNPAPSTPPPDAA